MDCDQFFEKLLFSFERYYTITKDNVLEPFTAQAEFKSHSEQCMLVKAAKIADIDSNDFVYFKLLKQESLSAENVENFVNVAWNDGLSKITPYYGHRNSDITVIILSETIEKDTIKKIKKTNFSKSYKFGIYGWSNLRLCAMELSSGQIYYNRFGSDLKKILANIKNSFLKGENK